jgi:RNA polymerase sigma-70 factor (ECF subfamily)
MASASLCLRPSSSTIREVALGEARELDLFLAGVERRAFRIARAQLGDPDDALDAVQDAMFKLVRKYAARPSEEWAPLFWTILRSRVTDQQRRRTFRRRFDALLGRDADGELRDPLDGVAASDDPVAQLAQQGALAAVEHAVRALPERQQQAFLLRVYEGLSVADTAQAMGCGEGSVKTHLSRAMDALRGVLEEHV